MGFRQKLGQYRKQFREPHSLQFSTMLLTVGGFLSKGLGVARQWLMAALFGTSAATDSWLIASIVPSLVFDIISGTFNLVLMPLLAGRTDVRDGNQSVDIFVNEIFSWTLVVGVVLIIILEVVSAHVVHWIAPGFFGLRYQLTLVMLRIMLPMGPFLVLGNFMNGILQAHRSFQGRAITPIIINFGRIVTIATLGVWLHIEGVAIGFVIANIAQLAYLVPALRRQHVHLRLRLRASHPWTRQYARLSIPVFLSHSVQLGGTIVDRIFASTLAVGRIAGLNFAQVLIQIPLTLAITPFVTPIYTELSHIFNREGANDAYRRLAYQGFQAILVIIAPFFLTFLFLRQPLIAIFYEHGRFNAASASLTSRLMLYWAIGLPGEALGMFFARILLSQQETRYSSYAGMGAIMANILGDFLLIHPMGSDGLALATSIAGWMRAVGQSIWMFRHHLNPFTNQKHFLVGWSVASLLFAAMTFAGNGLIRMADIHAWYLLLPLAGIILVVAFGAYMALLVKTRAIPAHLLMRGPLKRWFPERG